MLWSLTHPNPTSFTMTLPNPTSPELTLYSNWSHPSSSDLSQTQPNAGASAKLEMQAVVIIHRLYAVQGRDTSVRDVPSRECNIRERDESSNNKHIGREHSVTGVYQ